MPVLIPLISIGVGVGTTLYASSKASKAQQQASTAQQASTQAALDQEWRMYQQARADLGPGREAQAWALSQLIGGGGAAGGGFGVDSPELTQARSNLQDLERQYSQSPFATAQGGILGAIGGPLDDILARPGAENFGGVIGQIRDARAEVAQLEQAQQQQFGAGVGAGGGFAGLLAQGPGEYDFTKRPAYGGFEEYVRKPFMQMMGARGKRLSGEMLTGLSDRAMLFRGTDYENFLNEYKTTKLNPLLSIAGMGQVSAGGSANLAAGMGANIANLQLQQGNIQAQNAQQQGNIATQTAAGIGGTVQNALQEYLNLQANRQVPGSGYGYGVL